MVIAVIGDYSSPEYKELLKNVKRAKPEEEILDLSRHRHLSWSVMLNRHFTDISNAHMVVIGAHWRNDFAARRGINEAQEKHKECLIEINGQFRPFPEYSDSF